MKILNLTAENIKKLVAVEITPDGNIVQITGKNGQGKTSVLDSIWWALAGTEHIQAQPIRKGEKTARIRLDLGEMRVERRFTEKGNYLSVETVDGAKYPSPQKMLDDLIGALSFDPLGFVRMPDKKQFDELRRVSKLKTDIDAIDRANKEDYARRTDLNREAKSKRAQGEGIMVPAGLPASRVDESSLLDGIQQAADENAKIEQRKARRQEAAQQADVARHGAATARDRAADLRRQAETLDATATELEAQAATLQKKIDEANALPDPVNIATLRAALDAAKQVNAQISERERREKIEAEAEDLEAKSAKLTNAMDERAQQKMDAIAKAEMPVAGLGFGDGIVTYNGVPLEQASSAEQLRVSLGIAMAANPRLRVIRIQDGSLLDDESLAQIADMAKDQDYQVWIERVDSSGKVGFIIEDGHVKTPSES